MGILDIGHWPTDRASLVPMNLDVETDVGEEDQGDPITPVLADTTGESLETAPVRRLLALARLRTGKTETERLLENLGWRIRTTGELHQAVRLFQGAVVIGGDLVVDGIAGPKTRAKLALCEDRRKRGLPTASAHFSFVEFRCRCGGKYSNCARIWTRRDSIKELEKYRRELGHGFGVVSGCRCPGHNHDVGGATQSRHMVGDATDFPPEKPVKWFREHGLFEGRGWNHAPASHPVRHGDLGRPREWQYS